MSYWQQQTISRRTALRGAAISGLGLAGSALIGCSSGAKPSSPAGTPGTAGAPAAANAGQQPVVSESIVALQFRDAASLDPLASQVYTTPERIGLVYPRLIYYTRAAGAPPSDTKQVPSYAVQSWEFAGDGATLTFKMRKGVKYSNTAPLNGRELVAQDVKYSFDRYMTDPTSTFKARYTDIASIETPDNYTVVFKLKKPSRYVTYALAAEPSLITPPEIGKAEGDFKTKAIGPGPFIHEQTIQGEGSQFKKNPDFIDAAKIYYNRYQIKVITDAATRIAALRTNQADYSAGGASLSKTDVKSAESPNVKIEEQPQTGNYGFWFNMNNPKWKDIRARTAISKAFDRQALIDQSQQGDASFNGPIPVGFGKWALTEKELRESNAYKYDVAEAKKLWDAAGKPSQQNAMYIPPKAIQPVASTQAELIGEQLQANLGIKTVFSTDEYSNFVSKVYNNKFDDVALFGMALFDPVDYLLAQFYPGGTRNGPALNDPEVIKRLDDLRGTMDENAAVQKAREIAKYLTESVLSMSHLPVAKTWNAYNAKLQAFLPGVQPPGIEWTLSTWKSK